RQDQLESFNAQLSNKDAALSAAGSLTLATNQANVLLSTLTWSTHRQPLLQLTEPCEVSVRHTGLPEPWQVTLRCFNWAGAGGNLNAEAAIRWPAEGVLHASAQKLASTNFTYLVKSTLPEINVKDLNAAATWSNSPVKFELGFLATGTAQKRGV